MVLTKNTRKTNKNKKVKTRTLKKKAVKKKEHKSKNSKSKNSKSKNSKKNKRGGDVSDTLPENINKGDLIGKGTWGEVYEATWEEDGNEKTGVIKFSKSINKLRYRMNLHEVEILKYLTEKQNKILCPTNISIYGYKKYDNKKELEILMEYFKGVELKEIAGMFDFSVDDEIQKWNAVKNSLLDAVNCLHNLNVTHRDIKLENIMIKPETLDIKLIDFGFACHKKTENLSETWGCTNLAGTPWYLSPELFMYKVNNLNRKNGLKIPYKQFEEITWEMLLASDIWALGMTLYALVYGKKLFEIYFENKNIKATSEDIQRSLIKIGRGTKNIEDFITHPRSEIDCVILYPIIMPLLELDISKRIENFNRLVEAL